MITGKDCERRDVFRSVGGGKGMEGAESHYSSRDGLHVAVFVTVLICCTWFCWFYQFG